MKPDYEYVVLSESDVKHLVCVCRRETPDWLQVIASFVDLDRAEQYANIENDMAHDDEPRADVAAETPAIEAPPDQLRRLVRGTITEPVRIQAREEPHAVVEAQDEPPQLAPGPEPEPEPEAKAAPEPELEKPPAEGAAPESEPDHVKAGAIPEFILRFLPGWMEKYPGGPTIKQVVDECKLSEPDVRAAFNEIRRREMAVVYQEKGGEPLRVAPLGFDPPPRPDLSQNQKAVLNYLGSLPSDGDTVAPPSMREMHEHTGVPQGSLGGAISDLERKGKIKTVKRGDQFNPPRYKVVDRQILRQDVQRGQPRDVSHLVFNDPPPERSALAEKRRRESEVAE
jgi:DNA-binding MarR family transcriptional regulator